MLPQAMRLRRAVPKIPPGCPVPLRLPLYKNRLLLTHSESTLPQVLIPLHFNFRRIRVYKKTGERLSRFTQRFCNSSLPPRHPSAHARTAANPITSMAYSRFSGYPGGRGRHTSARSSFFRISYFEFRISYFDSRISSSPFAAAAFDCGLSAVGCQRPPICRGISRWLRVRLRPYPNISWRLWCLVFA